MRMMPNSFRVEVADNGFVVRYDDPEIIKKNRRDEPLPWQDPERIAVFPDVDSMKAGLDTVIESVVKAAAEEQQSRASDFMGGFEATAKEG